MARGRLSGVDRHKWLSGPSPCIRFCRKLQGITDKVRVTRALV